jgi:hypothetical protein
MRRAGRKTSSRRRVILLNLIVAIFEQGEHLCGHSSLQLLEELAEPPAEQG